MTVIRARIENGSVIPLTDADQKKLSELFPDGNVFLTSENCPELAAEIERQSEFLLEQNKQAYEALANYD